MAQKTFYLAEVGEVTLAKRRGNRNIRLSITSSGTIRVSMPPWTPYQAGVNFLLANQAWLKKHMAKVSRVILQDGDRIGRSHQIFFLPDPALGATVKTRVSDSKIIISSSLPLASSEVQARLKQACERALKHEAEALLPGRLKELAGETNHRYKSLNIKKLTSRWGSCSSHGDISLSFYLVQLPWRLIDYVLVHELVHTVHKHHQADFWAALADVMPDARLRRKELHSHKPAVEPNAMLTNYL